LYFKKRLEILILNYFADANEYRVRIRVWQITKHDKEIFLMDFVKKSRRRVRRRPNYEAFVSHFLLSNR